ncbi:MAG TPA: quinolinate synthase NadA [Bacillota bacterium]|nr:quinolinate synthase NadA [Bacillota bacterium]HPF42432.1 quinolinate synthase NadA [Bacillota bacterium]HPJ85435.1 quinolinate synthase NadA [Bacillota bacterium]HPQ61269.1 quinolinate synthase NadA [Bacillota bacterium]HRX91667.1 quinolinate synthase NadA [Candidatus Izemoplasmatales bacterium]
MLKDDILVLKKEKNAVILAHFYERPEIQDVADYVGDSLALSRIAADTTADIIVFCGVNFMAETAKILSPDKTVLLPVKEAGCPLALTINANKLQKYKDEHPDTVIVCYVNSPAEVKALSDVCVTSSNAEKIVSSLKGKKILYVPDKNMAGYLKDKLQIELDIWPGFCPAHNRISTDDVIKTKKRWPDAKVLIHPEAPLEVLKLADYVGSTKGILDYAKSSDATDFIIGTEEGIIYPLTKENPEKKFHLLPYGLYCRDMKLTHIDDVYNALKTNKHEIQIDESIRKAAKKALDKMLEMS